MLYQHALCTTVPQHICHTNPHATADCDHLDQCASLSAANHDCQGCQQKAPLFARQTLSVLNDARCLWLPATVIHSGAHGLYIVQVISGGQYQHACNHIHEHHPDAIKPDKHITTNVAPASPTHPSATQAVATSTMCCTCNTSSSCNTLHTTEDIHYAHNSPCTVSYTKAD